MNTTLTLMPIVALFLALSWHTRPTLAAIVATAVYLMLLIAIARMARRHRQRHRRVSPRLLAYLVLTAVTIAYPFCNRDRVRMLLDTDDAARANAKSTQLYARPLAGSASLAGSAAPVVAHPVAGSGCGSWEAFDFSLNEDFDESLADSPPAALKSSHQ